MRPTESVVRGSSGSENAREHRAGDRRGVNGVRHAERRPAVPTSAAEVHAKAARAERAVDDALVAGAVEGDGGGGVAHLAPEQRLRSAQITRALLARGRDEDDGGARAERIAVDGARECEHRREAAAVVANAGAEQTQTVALHAERHSSREHRVEVRANHHRSPLLRALASANDIAGGVRVHARESELAESRRHPGPTLLLLPGGRRDL